jgi:O-succinylbenzoic acid--CoA ligase
VAVLNGPGTAAAPGAPAADARPLVVVPADAETLLAALPEALAGQGPALLPVSPETEAEETAFVEQAGGLAGARAAVAASTAVVVRTSGSTGHPKRVELSGRALLASARSTNAILGAGRWLLALPVHYIAGLQVLVRSLVAGTVPVVLPSLAGGAGRATGHFTAEAFTRATARLRAESPDAPLLTALVPAQLHTLLADAREHAETLAALRAYRTVLVGGQRTDPGLLDLARARRVAVVTTYGGSETSGGVVYGLPDGTQRLVADTRLAVIDRSILIAGSTLATGYLGDPARTAQAFVERAGTRWLVTGDLGDLNEGVLTVTGRDDQIIITGGLKLDLNEVTRVLHELPGLADAVAVPFDDEKWGTRFAVYADGRDRTIPRLTRDELNAVLRARLGRHAGAAAITYFSFGLPRLPSGKVDLSSLYETAEKLAGTALAVQRDRPPRDAV